MIIQLITGHGEVTVDNNTQGVTQGDVLFCKGEEVFSIKNTGDTGMSCFAIITPNPSAIYSKEI